MADRTVMQHILVVEDDPTVRALMISILARSHRSVSVVDSGEQALAHIQKHSIDLFLIDKNLPGIDGVTLIEKLRETDRVAGVLMVTGYASEDSAFKTLNLGIDGYLEKPFDVDVIEDRVKDALARRNRRAHLHQILETAREGLRSVHEASEADTPLRYLVASPLPEEQRRLQRDLEGGSDAVSIVGSSSACLGQMRHQRFDVVVLDTALRDPDVVAVARTIKQEGYGSLVVVIGERPSIEALQELIDLEVKAVIDRHQVETQFADRVKTLAAGVRLTKLADKERR